jgi:hypothetical protein
VPIETLALSAVRASQSVLLAAAIALGVTVASAAETGPAGASGTVVASAASGGALRYDRDYPTIDYGGRASANAIAHLQERLDRGEVRLAFHGERGYLDSLLKALEIDASSQTLVYSKTSLQFELIRAATPRAIYFNDDTYVAWVPGTNFIEIATMDAERGPVFYTLPNREPTDTRFSRETFRCLSCHDTFSLSGGGVPRFLFASTVVDTNGQALNGIPGADTTDQTPLSERWGGWYVTGNEGPPVHLGNILVEPHQAPKDLASVQRADLPKLAALFDTEPYPRDTSDIVALLVFEHQAYIHSLISRANFKSRTLIARLGHGATPDAKWSDLPPTLQRSMQPMLEGLVRAMLFVNAAPIADPIAGSSGFDQWFEAQGPRDERGRSLRELDLGRRVFRHRLSYLVYSAGFDGLPGSARDYIYGRFSDIFAGRDRTEAFSDLDDAERRALLEILTATKPAFAAATRERT